ncbi:MAG: NAD(P)(+) transhydrogenase (Re/Si-specific) subunit beta [Leptospiraceae bacterium]|nr:NAD(P)(+) transhydrogenase (Re/Si-specific) subunit beta [Leptospiraceae bacterium]MCP5496919.1 NAD(P)(+) transhydrogenase (Re/Si-specific) subunit beta [Leptospiraceae bacterium]
MEAYIEISYLVASLSFVFGLKMMGHPDSARKGNLLAAVGMFLAILLTVFLYQKNGHGLHNYAWIFTAIVIGTVLGAVSAKKVDMKAMPQMVSLFNGMGGACAAVISVVEFTYNEGLKTGSLMSTTALVILLGTIIGSISFSGSMIAFGKLQGYKAIEKPVTFPGQFFVNNLFLLASIVLGVMVMMKSNQAEASMLFYALFGTALLYGILFVLPIGGADMPVVISLLNSFTGMAAAFAGFLYGNKVMLTGGILVGSAGTILTVVMCKAMNRSLANVIFGGFGTASGEAAAGGAGGVYKEISPSDAAMLLKYSSKVVIVPGYGLAVAQAQHAIHEMDKLLEAEGVEVKYAIHPVAGRMPGHMNVLLAEADVPYPKLCEMDDINPDFPSTDVVIVVGANDVVNPAAKRDKSSPIYGMPILEAEEAKNIIVLKRGRGAGYAGIENELFFNDKTKMLFGNAKDTITQLVSEIKSV